MIKLFLDDVRIPTDCINYMKPRIGSLSHIYSTNEDWHIVRNYAEFEEFVTKYYFMNIKLISFDHDLAHEHYAPEQAWTDSEKYTAWLGGQNFECETGEDCAKFLKAFYEKENFPLPEIIIHSMNPNGVKSIENVFNLKN